MLHPENEHVWFQELDHTDTAASFQKTLNISVWLCLLSTLSHSVQKTMGLFDRACVRGGGAVLEGLDILILHTEKLRLRLSKGMSKDTQHDLYEDTQVLKKVSRSFKILFLIYKHHYVERSISPIENLIMEVTISLGIVS